MIDLKLTDDERAYLQNAMLTAPDREIAERMGRELGHVREIAMSIWGKLLVPPVADEGRRP